MHPCGRRHPQLSTGVAILVRCVCPARPLRAGDWPVVRSTWIPSTSLTMTRVGDAATCSSPRKGRRPRRTVTGSAEQKQDATEPATTKEYPGWVFHDTEDLEDCFFAKITHVRQVPQGEEHEGEMGVWFKQIRTRVSNSQTDWALLSDVEMRVASGEYEWVGYGRAGEKEAKRLWKANYNSQMPAGPTQHQHRAGGGTTGSSSGGVYWCLGL